MLTFKLLVVNQDATLNADNETGVGDALVVTQYAPPLSAKLPNPGSGAFYARDQLKARSNGEAGVSANEDGNSLLRPLEIRWQCLGSQFNGNFSHRFVRDLLGPSID